MLSGVLSEFPVGDLLRLLSVQRKTGVLEIAARGMRPRRVRLERGYLADEGSSDAPAELIADLRRVADGSFRFVPVEPGQVHGIVHDTLAALEQSDDLVAEWVDVDRRMAPGTVVRPVPRDTDQDWRLDPVLVEALQAIGTGAADRLLASRLGISHIAAARLVVDLLDAGLVAADTVVDVTALERATAVDALLAELQRA